MKLIIYNEADEDDSKGMAKPKVKEKDMAEDCTVLFQIINF